MTQWRLDTPAQTLILGVADGRMAAVLYWGAPLPADEDAAQVAAAQVADVTGGMLDENPPLSVCPLAARSFPGQPGIGLRDAEGRALHPDFRFLRAEADATGLALHHRDDPLGLTLTARFVAHPETGLIEASAELESDAPVWLDWLAAPVLPAPQWGETMIDFAGRWCGEFQPVTTRWSPGIRLRESRTGRTGHEHFPGLYLPGRGATNTRGPVHALHYGWSGGHRMIAEELPDGRRQIQFGHAAGTETRPRTRFVTAPLYMAVSDRGLNGCAVAFQRHVRDHLVPWPDRARPRPVHYNCWEAIYFDHDLPRLKEIAAIAADLGAERFVLDDGWFGRRNDDTSSLGDWRVDPRKYPDGLGPLIDHVRELGMSFGIWFEPEMVNLDSDLARAHPDWILGAPDQIEGRQQRVLNLALPQVRDHLFGAIAAILSAHPIDYVKWDHNRVLPLPDADQTRGTYELLDRLRAAFPGVEFESCASGGGRIDFGILSRTHRVWLSDSNDALERLRIQHDAALFLPAAVTGSHVGPRHCHTSGRQIDIALRAWVAAQRHMGFEMDPRELTPHEATVLREVTAWWKANRDWLMAADILRLDSPDPAVTAEIQVARAQDRFVLFAALAESSAQILPRPLELAGLDPRARYRLTLLYRDQAPGLSRGAPALKSGTLTLSGQYLMSRGLTLPWAFPQTMWVIEGHKE